MQQITDLPSLTVKWWKWFLNDEPNDSPIFFAASKRMTIDDKETLNAYYQIKRDKPILVSVDKWISLGFLFSPDDKLRQVAKERIDSLTKMHVSFDDKHIIDSPNSKGVLRIMSPIFYITLKHDMQKPELGPKKIPKGRYKAVSDGYWLFLQPNSLTTGDHVIEAFGSCQVGKLSLNVRHHLTIT